MNIRVRLTLWYAGMLTLMLIAFAVGVYAFVAAEERQSVDRILRERVESFQRAFAGEAAEGSTENALLEVAQNFSRGEGDTFVYGPDGKLMSRSPLRLLRVADARSIPELGLSILASARGQQKIVTVDGIRCLAAPVTPRRGYVLVTTESLAGRHRALQRLSSAFLLLIPAALVIATLGGYVLAARSLAPVARMTETASRIEAENLSQRIEVRNPGDELGRLGTVINALLERLDHSFQQQKQLLADTSHELRTPIAIVRSEAEVTLSRERDSADYRRSLEVIRSEASHVSRLLEDVLLLARADAQQRPVAHESFSLAAVIEESVRALHTLAEARQVELRCSVDGEMAMQGDAELIRRMLLNLLDNAIKFTESGGRVDLDAHRAGAHYVISVTDSGHGIPREAQERIFDRFFRVDAARGRGSDRDEATGTGLGLSIARWIARAHGGDLRLLRSGPAGSIFEATLAA